MKTIFKMMMAAMIAVSSLALNASANSSVSANTATATTAQKKTTASKASAGLTLTGKGLGSVTIGMAKASLPTAVAGLYNSKSYTRIDPETSMDCRGDIAGYYICKLNGKETCAIYIDSKGKVCGIYVTTPSIKSTEGVKPGMPAASVKRIAGMRYAYDEMDSQHCFYAKSGVLALTSEEVPDKIHAIVVGAYY